MRLYVNVWNNLASDEVIRYGAKRAYDNGFFYINSFGNYFRSFRSFKSSTTKYYL